MLLKDQLNDWSAKVTEAKHVPKQNERVVSATHGYRRTPANWTASCVGFDSQLNPVPERPHTRSCLGILGRSRSLGQSVGGSGWLLGPLKLQSFNSFGSTFIAIVIRIEVA